MTESGRALATVLDREPEAVLAVRDRDERVGAHGDHVGPRGAVVVVGTEPSVDLPAGRRLRDERHAFAGRERSGVAAGRSHRVDRRVVALAGVVEREREAALDVVNGDERVVRRHRQRVAPGLAVVVVGPRPAADPPARLRRSLETQPLAGGELTVAACRDVAVLPTSRRARPSRRPLRDRRRRHRRGRA